jgi:hypothetical protein
MCRHWHENVSQFKYLRTTVKKMEIVFMKKLRVGVSCLRTSDYKMQNCNFTWCFVWLWNLASYTKVKVKVKLSLCSTKHLAMKTYRGSGGIAPRILDLSTRWRWVVSFTPLPLYPQGKSPWYPLDRRLSGPESRSGRGGEEKNSQPPPGIEP